MNASRSIRLLLAAAALLLAACATQRGAQNLLQATLYDYSAAIRWNRFDAAAGFLDPEQLAKKPLRTVDMKRYDHIQVTSYTVQGSEHPSPDELRQLVELRLVNRHTQVERVVIVHEVWRHDADAKRWWLTSGLPDITEPR